jgi:hypothetical protein
MRDGALGSSVLKTSCLFEVESTDRVRVFSFQSLRDDPSGLSVSILQVACHSSGKSGIMMMLDM